MLGGARAVDHPARSFDLAHPGVALPVSDRCSYSVVGTSTVALAVAWKIGISFSY